MLALARHVRRPPVPNVLLAAVHFLLAETPTHPLARFYGSLSEHPLPAGDAYPDFRDFVLANRATLIPLLETRITQTNEVGRCSSLMPYGTATAGDPASPVTIRCELRGPVMPPLPRPFPDCVFRLVKGDATRVLEAQLEDVPLDTLLVVYNSAALCQGGVADQNAVRSVLAAFSGRRPVYWLYCENEEVLLRTLDNGHMMELKLANKDGHGRWLEWL